MIGDARSRKATQIISPAGHSCRGFTYIGLLIAVAFIGVALAAVGTVWSQTRQREKERELLFVGGQFRQAIDQYYENPPPGKIKQFPKKLEDLLQDDRFPFARRYLRKIYLDPMTGSAEWGLLRGADKSIVGVYSPSDSVPLKTANFDIADAALAGKQHYYEWRFVAPKGVIVTGVNAAVSPADTGLTAQTADTPGASPPSDAQLAGIEQNPPAATAEPQPPNEMPPEDQRRAQCDQSLLRARTACFAITRKSGAAAASNCFQSAGTQYAQCQQ